MIIRLLIRMVPERNVVLLIREGYDPLRVLLRNREQILEYINTSLAKIGREIVKNQVRIGLTHSATILNIVSHDNIVQCIVGGWTVRQMAHRQRIRLASRLMNDHKIGAFIRSTGFNQLFGLVVTAVDPLRVGEYELQFFGEHFEPGARPM